jgi:hypothetical protein
LFGYFKVKIVLVYIDWVFLPAEWHYTHFCRYFIMGNVFWLYYIIFPKNVIRVVQSKCLIWKAHPLYFSSSLALLIFWSFIFVTILAKQGLSGIFFGHNITEKFVSFRKLTLLCVFLTDFMIVVSLWLFHWAVLA